jgi:hypothetical protein
LHFKEFEGTVGLGFDRDHCALIRYDIKRDMMRVELIEARNRKFFWNSVALFLIEEERIVDKLNESRYDFRKSGEEVRINRLSDLLRIFLKKGYINYDPEKEEKFSVNASGTRDLSRRIEKSRKSRSMCLKD